MLAALPLSSGDPELVRGSYLSLREIGWYALVPFGFASWATGLIQSLGTTWGLLRHYWALLKLLMNLLRDRHPASLHTDPRLPRRPSAGRTGRDGRLDG